MQKTERAATLGDVLADRGLTIREAAQQCGVSARLIEVLVEGGVTLPSLAMQIGRCLGLPTEHVKRLGRPLNRENFKRATGIAPLVTDCDPKWWLRYRRDPAVRPAERVVYLNEARLMEHILQLDGDMTMLMEITGGITPAAINKRHKSQRPQLIRAVEERLGLPEGDMMSERKPENALEIVFLPDKQAIVETMARRKLTITEMERTPPMYLGEMYRILEAADTGRAITIETMQKLATVMGVELCLLGRKIIRVNNKGNRRSM